MEKTTPPTPPSVGQYFKTFGKKVVFAFKHPLMLLPTVLIMGIWILLGFLKSHFGESRLLSVFNFLTFAQGGLFGGVVGAIGGIIGKIMVAGLLNALILPLFVRGKKPGKRFREGFRQFGESLTFDSLRALSVFLLGMGLSLLLYSLVNITQRWQEGLVGVAGALVLIQSISRKGGMVGSLLYSLVAGLSKKIPSQITITRFISGMSVGFVAGTGLSLVGLRWAVLLSLCFLVLGVFFFIFGNRKKAALAAACICAFLLLPVRADEVKKATDKLRGATETLDGSIAEANQLVDELNSLKMNFDPENLPEDFVDRMDEYNSRIETAKANRDNKEVKRLYDEMSQYYNESTGASMDFYKMYKGGGKSHSGGGDGGSADFTDTPLTHAWADEDSYVDSDGAAAALEAGSGLMAAGAAAGGGMPFGGGEGPFGDDPFSDGPFGDGGGPEYPEEPESEPETESGSESETESESEETEESEQEEDSSEDEEAEEEGAAETSEEESAEDSPEKEEEPAEEPEESEEQEEEPEAEEAAEEEEGEGSEEEEETDKEEPEEESEEDTEESGEESEEEEEAEEKSEEDEGREGAEDSSGDGEASDYQEEQPEGQYEEEQPIEEAEEEDDYDYEAERAQREAEQAAINERYQSAFRQDADQFASHSDEDRINKEIEDERRAAWDAVPQEEKDRQERVKEIAEKHGVDTVDTLGEERDIEDIQRDTENVIRHDYINELHEQQVCAETERFYSERIAEAEFVDNVSEGTINVLGECTGPGGKQVKNWYSFVKSTAVGYEEAKCEGRNRLVGTLGGAFEGGITVGQNIIGDDGVLPGPDGIKKTLAVGLTNVYFEGTKTLVHEVSRGKSLEESVEKAQTSMVRKSGEVVYTSVIGTTLDKVPGLAGTKFGAGEGTQKTISNVMKGITATTGEVYDRAHDNMTVADKNISQHLTEDFNDWKNAQAEKLF